MLLGARRSRFPSWLLLVPLGCADLTAPQSSAGSVASAESAAAAVPSAAPTASATASARVVDDARVTGSHILIAFKGALRATTNRSKEQARALATAVLDRVRKGEDFGALAARYSDDPSGKSAQGSLGSFPRNSMVRPLSDVGRLQPGQVELVETEFGFHIIKRTE